MLLRKEETESECLSSEVIHAILISTIQSLPLIESEQSSSNIGTAGAKAPASDPWGNRSCNA